MDEIDKLWDEIAKIIKERDQLRNTLKGALADANYWANQYAQATRKLEVNEGIISVWYRRIEEAEAKLAAEQASKAAVVEALHRTCAERNEAKQQLTAEQERSKTLSTALHQAWDDRDATELDRMVNADECNELRAKLAKLRAVVERVQAAYSPLFRSEYWREIAAALKETE